MPLPQLSRGHKFVVFFAVFCTLLIGLHLSSLSPIARIQQWRLPAQTPDLHDKDHHTSQGDAVLQEPYAHESSSIAAAAHSTTPALIYNSTASLQVPATTATPISSVHQAVLPCHDLPGAEGVLVVMRTGATEIKDKLPAHLNTTFKCYPHHIIFSDYAESFLGYEVHDVLKDIPDEIKAENDDFAHWRHIQEVGRAGLDDSELSGELSEESPATGKGFNAGWKLDKWKFLPMINQTLAAYPEMKWYIFVEPDTYLVWSSLLQWIENIDASKAYYFGSETMIGDDLFGHGGSGFLISNSAMKKGAALYNSKSSEWDEYVAGHWAGDGVLGVLLREAGVDLTWTNPMIQGGNPTVTIDFEATKGDTTLWCIPAITYHHVTPAEVRGMFRFEQNYVQSLLAHSDRRRLMFANWGNDMGTVIHHRDTFKSFVQPNTTSERTGWDNAADEQVHDTAGADMTKCRGLCEMKSDCHQYAVKAEGCFLGSQPRMGRPRAGVSSGWMNERVQAWVQERDDCEGRDGWVAP